jgi:hypothetical protein
VSFSFFAAEKKNKILSIIALSFVMIFSSCSTLLNTYKANIEGVPLWTLQTPSGNLQLLYFTGAGTDSSGDDEKARSAAAENLLTEVSSFLRYSVTESYKQKLFDTYAVPELTLKIIDEVETVTNDSKVTIHLLAQADRRVISELVRDNIESTRSAAQLIDQPLRQAETALSRKEDYTAVQLLLDAAAQAHVSTLTTAAGQYIQTMNKVIQVLEGFRLQETASDKSSGTITLQLTRGDGLFASKIPGAVFIAEFPIKNSSGKVRLTQKILKTGNNGQIQFSTDHPGFRGDGTVSFYLDLYEAVSRLEKAVGSDDPMLKEVKNAADAVSLNFSYSIVSSVTGNRLALSLLEYDASGRLIQTHPGLERMIEMIQDDGYTASPIFLDSLNNGSLADYTEEQVIEQMQKTYDTLVTVGMVGTAGITSMVKSGSGYIATTKGKVRSFYLDSGNTIGDSGIMAANGTGPDIQSAAAASLRRFGEIAADHMLSLLR